jgi:hypothetical protein
MDGVMVVHRVVDAREHDRKRVPDRAAGCQIIVHRPALGGHLART